MREAMAAAQQIPSSEAGDKDTEAHGSSAPTAIIDHGVVSPSEAASGATIRLALGADCGGPATSLAVGHSHGISGGGGTAAAKATLHTDAASAGENNGASIVMASGGELRPTSLINGDDIDDEDLLII